MRQLPHLVEFCQFETLTPCFKRQQLFRPTKRHPLSLVLPIRLCETRDDLGQGAGATAARLSSSRSDACHLLPLSRDSDRSANGLVPAVALPIRSCEICQDFKQCQVGATTARYGLSVSGACTAPRLIEEPYRSTNSLLPAVASRIRSRDIWLESRQCRCWLPCLVGFCQLGS